MKSRDKFKEVEERIEMIEILIFCVTCYERSIDSRNIFL